MTKRVDAKVAVFSTLFFSLFFTFSVCADDQSNPVIVGRGIEIITPRLAGESDLPKSFSSGFLAKLNDGRIINVYNNDGKLEVCYSKDNAVTWVKDRVFPPPSPDIKFGKPSVVQTTTGAIIAVTYGWIKYNGKAESSQSDLWVFRSLDNGKSWESPRKIWSGYTGMTQGILETGKGNLIIPFCYLGSSTSWKAATMTSTDDGCSWSFCGPLEIPEQVDYASRIEKKLNGGALEPSVVELNDGRIWMVIRTLTGFLWESFSQDAGLSWSSSRQTLIGCGGPVFCTRLSDGKIAIIGNYSDWTELKQRGFPYGYSKGVILLSADDAKTWSGPIIYASGGKRTVHSMILEYEPGQLLINMMERSIMLKTSIDKLSAIN